MILKRLFDIVNFFHFPFAVPYAVVARLASFKESYRYRTVFFGGLLVSLALLAYFVLWPDFSVPQCEWAGLYPHATTPEASGQNRLQIAADQGVTSWQTRHSDSGAGTSR